MFRIINGYLIRRLALMFLLMGIIPIILFTLLPAFYQYNTIEQTAERTSGELQRQAEIELSQLAKTNAAYYDQIFSTAGRDASALANIAQEILSESVIHYEQDQALLIPRDLISVGNGFLVNAPDSEFGFKASPLARLEGESLRRQRALLSAVPFMKTISQTNPSIRSVFYTTKDQTIWIYPNLFWQDDRVVVPQNVQDDLTKRPYYQITRDLVWTQPYEDMEPVITVAAPIWVGEEFMGMAGIDLSLSSMIRNVVSSEIGNKGFLVLTDDHSNIIAMSESAHQFLQIPASESVLERSLLLAFPASKRTEIEALINTEHENSITYSVSLLSGDAYLAVSAIPSIPWKFIIIKPAEEVSRFALEIEESLRSNTSSLLVTNMITLVGILIATLLSGLILLKQIAIPVQKLIAASQAIANGDLSIRVDAKTGDDLAILANTFNEMADSVQKMQVDILKQKATLAETLQTREQEFSAINRISVLANQPLDLTRNLTSALQICVESIQADFAAISLIDDNRDLYLAASYGFESERGVVQELSFNCMQAGLSRQSLESHKNIYVTDIQNQEKLITPGQKEVYKQLGVGSLAIVPLYVTGRDYGVLALMNRKPENSLYKLEYFLNSLAAHVLALIENAQLRHRMRTLLIYEERQRLARELHDSVTQSLFSLSLLTEGLRATQSADNGSDIQVVEAINQQTKSLQSELRTLINELRPIDLAGEYLDAALQAHVYSLKHTAGITVKLRIDGNTKNLPNSIQRHLNRITQEALSNIARHASATNAEVQLLISNEMAILEVRDDGRGFDPQRITFFQNESMGLTSMRERAELMGGALQIRSIEGKGTTVIVKIPLDYRAMELDRG